MQRLCAEKKAIGPRKRLNYSTLQSIVDKESASVVDTVTPTSGAILLQVELPRSNEAC